MSTPQYRAKVQQLANFLISVIPEDWRDASAHVAFPSEVRIDLEVSFRGARAEKETFVEVPFEILTDFSLAAVDVRKELARAGNPECRGFVFHLTKDGKSSLDVKY